MLLLSLALMGCGSNDTEEGPASPELPEPSQARAAAPEGAPDVLFITLDTTRADRIGAWGYSEARTDTLDALASSGRRYANAWSTMPLTIPSHSSMFTGQYPPTHGVRSNGDAQLSDDAWTLAEHLHLNGYHTVASVAAFVTTQEWGFGQGFDDYYEDVPESTDFWHAERPGQLVVDDVIGHIEKRDSDRPMFAWVHLYDAHFPYVPPEEYRTGAQGPNGAYDAELAYVDDQVARLIEANKDRPTLVVVVGDHGEALGAHGERTHGLFVYAGTQHIPWIMSGPGVTPEVIEEPVSLVDVAPTLLSVLGLPPMDAAEGRVVPGTDPKPVYMESYQLQQRFGVAPHLAVADGEWVLLDLPRPELYNRGPKGRGEVVDLAEEHPDEVARLQGLMAAFDFAAPSVESASDAPDDAAIRHLEALGYVEGGFLGDLDGPLPDPKDRMELIGLAQLAEMLTMQGEQKQLTRVMSKLADDYPDVVEFQSRMARIEAQQGKVAAAVERLENLLVRDPGNVMAVHTLATLYARAGRYDEASIRFQEAADLAPYAPRVRTLAVAALLEAEGGRSSALELARHYMKNHPEDHGVAALVGIEMIRSGQFEAAVQLLEHAIKSDQPEPDVAFHLAAVAKGRGDAEASRQMLRLELEHHPSNPKAVMALARSLGEAGDFEGQVKLIEPWLSGPGRMHFAPEHQPPAPDGLSLDALPNRRKTDPQMGDFHHALSQAQFNLKQYEAARTTLDRGLRIDADDSHLLLLDANLLWQEGKEDEAKGRFEQAKAAKEREGAADAAAGSQAP